MCSHSSYGGKLVNHMLRKELVFTQFRSCYYLLYQCLVPNTREALSLLVQHYSVPKDFKRSILSGENPRVCNQGILNYLLIVLRRDKNFAKFWEVVKLLANNPVLREVIERTQKGIHPGTSQSLSQHNVTDDHKESVFPIDEGALSVTDDDYCVSYAVTMVDVRSCTRPPRLFSPSSTYIGFEVLRSYYSALVRSMPEDYMNTIGQLESHFSGDHIGSILECRDVFTANQRILDCLIEQICTEQELLNFCDWFSSSINAPLLAATVENIRKECVKLSNSRVAITTTNATTSIAVAATTTTNTNTSKMIASSVNTSTPAETKIHSARPLLKDLQNNITPYYAAHWTVIGTQLGIHSGILQGIQASYPADAFRCCNKMLEIWLDTDCNATWDKIYKAIESPGVTKANLNLQQDNGIKFQPPPLCPANYIPRLEIINEISKVIVDDSSDENSTICIGTTVTIRGIGGIGKSTLAKALCYHPLVKKYFTHGFLWISLTPPRLSPEVVLRDIYNKLTSNSIMCNFSLLKDKIRLLFASFPCKLLIILDDVVDADDVTEYVEIFGSSKTVLTTRKNDINITIPSKKCFDIGPMKIFEAVQLLTWRIPQLAALGANDANKIQELAKDLYYWPLLLSLVRGQLYIHCTAWKESPTSALLNVRQKLQDKGLTAFDPQRIKKESAVKASINASLELLTNNEKYVLFHIVSGIGIGSSVLKACIFKFSKVSSEEFDKLIKNLWSHGLINVGEIMLPPKVVAHSCIEIHDVIAQYIVEEMPYDYHVFLTEVNIIDFGNCFLSIVDTHEINVTNVKTDAVIMIDVLLIPFIIRTFAVLTRAKQIEFSKSLDSLIESCSNILKTRAVMDFLKRKQPLSQIYGFVKENCRIMQSLLLDNKYDEAVAWITEYTENHPLMVLLESIQTLKKELINECKHNPELIELINKTIETVDLNKLKSFGNMISSIIYGRKVILEMIEAGATDEEIHEIWNQIS